MAAQDYSKLARLGERWLDPHLPSRSAASGYWTAVTSVRRFARKLTGVSFG
jgi:hypothetical protein